jgi:hypothetical protein
VSGYLGGAPVELVWWSRAHAEAAVDSIFAGDLSATADALASGVALRTSGLLARWQERLRHYRVWQPTHKRLAARVARLGHKPERLVERIEEALTERAPHTALLVMTELQADTVALAPNGPNVDRARLWLAEAREILLASQTALPQ